jgi:hypothetical protein
VGGQRHATALEENKRKNKNGIVRIAEDGNKSYTDLLCKAVNLLNNTTGY